MAAYLDTSALVKLVVREPESLALRRWLDDEPGYVSCSIARTELARALQRYGSVAQHRGMMLLRRVHLISVDDSLLDAAGALQPPSLRSLDAIHLAAAMVVSAEIQAIVTYDRRMISGASLLGLTPIAPS